MGIIPINFQSLNPNSAQNINNQSVNANLPIASLPEGNLAPMGTNIIGNGTSQVVAANLNLVLNPTVTEITNGNLLTNALGENLSIVSIDIQSRPYAVGNLISLQGIGNLIINANGDYSLLVDNINFSGALPTIDFIVANSNQSDNAIFSVFIDRLGTGGAFQANDDYVAISQGTNTSGNLLDNDNGDNLFIESFSLSSLPMITFLSGQTAQIQIYQQNNYLTVASIKIMADGNYYLTALNSIFNGDLPLITYVLRNNLGASDTAKLNIAINTNVNPPALPTSNFVIIPSQTQIPLPIPIVVPPIPEPLPILEPLDLTLNEDEQISYNLLNNLFPNIQINYFSINGQNFATGDSYQLINSIGYIKILPNGILNFYGNPNYNGFVPTVWYRITNGFEETNHSIDFLINPAFSLNDDPFFSSVSYWANGQSNFNDLIAPAAIDMNSHNILIEGNYNQNNINSRYANLFGNRKIAIGKPSLLSNSMTWEGFFKFTGNTNLQDSVIELQGGATSYNQTPEQTTVWLKVSNLNEQILLLRDDSTPSPSVNIDFSDWIHIALTLKNRVDEIQTTVKLFVNGINVLTSETYNSINLGNYIVIGKADCYCSHFRITKAERYTQNFNPLTESYLF
jgi:hypothetical protein